MLSFATIWMELEGIMLCFSTNYQNGKWRKSAPKRIKYLGTNNCKICRESEKTLSSQSNLGKKKKQSWISHDPCFKIILQSCNNQNCVVLAQKWTHKSMEQKRELRNKPMFIGSNNLRQRRQEYTLGKRQFLQ